MATSENKYYQVISSSFDELRVLCLKLKEENQSLKQRLSELEHQNHAPPVVEPDAFQHLNEIDRIALRNQITAYIKRIEQILEAE